MSDQLMWYQSLKAWYHIKLWADVLIVLVENDSDHVDFMIDLSLLKIEALIAMEQYAEALDSTKRLMNKHQSNKILSMLFKTMIYSEDCSLESAINQMKKICIERCPDMNIELKLQQFIECCYILYSIPKLLPANKTKGVLLCLEVWIDLFHQNQIWKLYEESTSGPSQDEFKVLEVVCQYFAYFGGYIGGSQGNDAKDSESVESCSISIDYTLIEAAIKHPEKQNKMLEMLQNKVHPIIRVVIDILNIASRKGISSDYFGKVETFKWLPLSLMELANLFLEQHKDMVTFESGNNKNSNTTVVAHLALLNCCCTNYLLANQLLEAAEQFNIVDKRKRVICLICSASVQLDCAAICSHKADNNDENAMDTSDFLSLATFTDENPLEDSKLSTEVIQYTNQAKENAEQAQNIITGSIEFADQMDRSLLNIAIFIQFQCFSRCGKIGNSEEFINHRENEIKLLSPESLMDCVELASSSSKFSMDAIRNLLRLCIETIAMSHTYSSYLGVLFRKIIDLSPSRKYALDKVTEFEHLLREKHSHLEMKDIDYIFAKSYNFTITLLELDQLSMAEQFAGKSECIGEYCSSEMQNWRDKIQVRNIITYQ